MKRLIAAAAVLLASVAQALPPVVTLPGSTISVPGGGYGWLGVVVAPPGAPTVNPNTTGATHYSYKIVSRSPTGVSLPSTITTITNGNAAANNTVTWTPQLGAISYDVYVCNGNACTVAYLANVTAPTVTYTDTTGSGSGAAPTIDVTNSYGDVTGGADTNFSVGVSTQFNWWTVFLTGSNAPTQQMQLLNGALTALTSVATSGGPVTAGTFTASTTHFISKGTAPSVGTFASCLGSTTSTSVTGGDSGMLVAFTTGTATLCSASTALFLVTLHTAYASANYATQCNWYTVAAGSAAAATSFYVTPASSSTFSPYNTLQFTPASSTAYVVQCITVGAATAT